MAGMQRGERILDSISGRITAITSTRMLLLSLAGFIITTIVINGRPFGAEQLLEITGGAGLLDMKVLYTPEQAYAHLAAMGEAGRAFDLTHIIPLDFVFPFMYTLFSVVAITWLLHRWLPADSRWHLLNVVPLIGGMGDFVENLGIIVMIVAWPAQLPAVALFTMVACLVKFTFIILSYLIIAGAVIGWTARRFRGSSGRSPA
jgi:hypothetical protein